MEKIERKLKVMGLALLPVASAVASYIPYVQVGNLLFLAGTTGERGDQRGMARAALYVPELTYNMAVETEVVVQLKRGVRARALPKS